MAEISLIPEVVNERPYIIKEASLKDDYVNYAYEIIEGVGMGDTHKVTGSSICSDDMRHSMGFLDVHLACIDDVFKHKGLEIEDIDRHNADELVDLYRVTGLQIKGSKDNESVVLIGVKYVSSAGGHIDMKTPKIPLDGLSSYQWYNELGAAVDRVRKEVALYKEGKCIKEEEEEKKPNPKQLTINDMLNNNAADDDTTDDGFEEFENTKVL